MTEISGFLTDEQSSQHLAQSLLTFALPLLESLDEQLDKRLVRTFYLSLLAILATQDSKQALLLSRLGASITSPRSAPAGTKRLDRLLACDKWNAEVIDDFLFANAQKLLEQDFNSPPLVLWDESVMEKHESIKLQGLSPIRSSKAKRLTRIKPGYYTPPRGPIFVPGYNCLGALLVHGNQQRFIALKHYGSRMSEPKSFVQLRREMFAPIADQWGKQVTHVFDRGYCGDPWLKELCQHDVNWVVRYRGDFSLSDEKGRRQVWRMMCGRKALATREQWDNQRKCHRPISVLYKRVQPRYPKDFAAGTNWTLVMCRHHKKGQPWYLLTNQEVESAEDAWRVVDQYAKRWAIEQMFRQHKSSLGYESARVYSEERRAKLLGLVHLAWAFLASQCEDTAKVQAILRAWCHRTGKRQRRVTLPFYRLRTSLAMMLNRHPPSLPPDGPWQNSG